MQPLLTKTVLWCSIYILLRLLYRKSLVCLVRHKDYGSYAEIYERHEYNRWTAGGRFKYRYVCRPIKNLVVPQGSYKLQYTNDGPI